MVLFNVNYLLSLLLQSLQSFNVWESEIIATYLNPTLWSTEVENLRDVYKESNWIIGAISTGTRQLEYLGNFPSILSPNMDIACFMNSFSFCITNCVCTMLDVPWTSTVTTWREFLLTDREPCSPSCKHSARSTF